MKLPALVSETCRTKIAPIVSSKRALQIILKRWASQILTEPLILL